MHHASMVSRCFLHGDSAAFHRQHYRRIHTFGIVYSLCGFMTAWQGQSMGDAAVWLPMICFALLRLNQLSNSTFYRTRKSVPCDARACRPSGNGGTPHAGDIGTGSVSVLDGEKRNDSPFAFICAGILAVGLAAIQIVPTLEWLRQLGQVTERIPPVLSLHDGQGFFSRDLVRESELHSDSNSRGRFVISECWHCWPRHWRGSTDRARIALFLPRWLQFQ
jgi:hypothetical protein